MLKHFVYRSITDTYVTAQNLAHLTVIQGDHNLLCLSKHFPGQMQGHLSWMNTAVSTVLSNIVQQNS